jgi:hypothetical protein
MNRKTPHSTLLIFATLIAGCGSGFDTEKMVGMSLEELTTKHHLDDALVWETPNLSMESDAEKTYYLDDGNLEIRFNHDGIVTSAIFEKRTDPAKDRLDAVQQGWSEYVRERTPNGDATE